MKYSYTTLVLQTYEWCVKYGIPDTLPKVSLNTKEEYLDRSLFWVVRLLHTNELKLRRLI